MDNKKRTLALPKDASFFLFGPRQVGKTSLIKQTFSADTTIYYDLLLNKDYTRLVIEPGLFREEVEALDPKFTHIVIDEIQKIPALLDEIHYLIEHSSIARYFVLSGSSARKLKRLNANLLAGRAWTRYLYPFTHYELAAEFKLPRALALGTLPSVYLNEDHKAFEILESYVETYLEQEIKIEANLRNLGSFLKFLRLAANESGNQLNYSNIARDTATSYKSIKEYFQVLEDTLLGFFLLPYDKAERKRLAKHPKFYLFDNGLRNALLKRFSSELMPGTTEYGIAFEHFIINQVRSLNRYLKKNYEMNFFRNNNNAEVDLILTSPNNEILAIEIKSTENPSGADLRGLNSFLELEPNAIPICVCNAPRSRKTSKGTMIYPWKEFFDKYFSF